MRTIEVVSLTGRAEESGIARLAMFLARSPMRSSVEAIFIAAISTRRSAATGWRSAITFTTRLLERHLHGVERPVALDHLAGQRGVAVLHRLQRLGEQLLAEPAHLGDPRLDLDEVLVEGRYDMRHVDVLLLPAADAAAPRARQYSRAAQQDCYSFATVL